MARHPATPLRFIASARDADLDDLVAIEQVAFPTPWSRESLAQEIQRPWSLFRVIRDASGRVLAYLNYWVVAAEVHVLNLATAPEARRTGLARLLLGEMLQRCRDNAIAVVHLEVRPSNRAARALYESLGFTQVGTRPGYYSDTSEDALLYALPIRAPVGEVAIDEETP